MLEDLLCIWLIIEPSAIHNNNWSYNLTYPRTYVHTELKDIVHTFIVEPVYYEHLVTYHKCPDFPGQFI